jgi:CRISPR-associated endoribonuclease Cas6
MRIHIKTNRNQQTVPFDHQHLLTGTIHKWFGPNKIHDGISLYSFSRLQNAKKVKQGFVFEQGTSFFISCWDRALVKKLVEGIQNDPFMFFGLKAVEIILEEDPDLASRNSFWLGSPIYIQRNLNSGKKQFYYYADAEAPAFMKETIETKMKVAGLKVDETLKISFDTEYQRKGTKKVNYKRGDQVTEIRANWCPVIIEGKVETKQFAWNVGIGNSTGIGFGAIK